MNMGAFMGGMGNGINMGSGLKQKMTQGGQQPFGGVAVPAQPEQLAGPPPDQAGSGDIMGMLMKILPMLGGMGG